MSMREYFEMGYKVVCESMFGDVEMEDMDMVECYEEDSEFDRIDEDAKVIYFADAQEYED